MSVRSQVGIVVPTLDSARTLEWTLLSLLRQTETGVRVVVADSYSSDGTLEICRRWDVPVIEVSAGNMYRAINAGIRTLETEWVGYLNSDDVLHLDGLKRLIEGGAAKRADVAYGYCDYIDAAGRFLYAMTPATPQELTDLFRRGIFPMAQPATVFRRRLALELGGFTEDLRYAADYDFFARAAISGARFVRIGTPSVAAFRVHSHQLSAIGAEGVKSEVARVRESLPRTATWRGIAAEGRWRVRNLEQTAISLMRIRKIRRSLPLK